MTRDRGGVRVKDAYQRLSTGMKMLIWLFAALLPLGLIAILASLYSARDYRANREIQTRARAAESAAKITASVARATLALRINTAAIAQRDPQRQLACRQALDTLAVSQPEGLRFAFFNASGRRICASEGFRPDPPAMLVAPGGYQVDMLDVGAGVSVAVSDSTGTVLATAEIPRETLARIARPNLPDGSYSITLWHGNEAMPLAEIGSESPLGQRIVTDAPLGDTKLSLQMVILGSPVRAIEVLMVLLPILMWIAAAGIGWFVVDRLLLRPLGQLQGLVDAYARGEPVLALPHMATPAQEIERLGEAFLKVTRTVSRHEAELEEGLARQTKLTREVHHRVKNNLQVVASLINLHARSAVSPDVSAAYASIQRRVDAIAVVHRNHYAELEENRGVGLRALIGELAANLRATAPPEHSGMVITLHIDPVHVVQDVAVPIAFLITELVELAMLCDPNPAITIRLTRTETPGRARIEIGSPALHRCEAERADDYQRFGRILTGLARQLRGKLERFEDEGVFALEIAIAD